MTFCLDLNSVQLTAILFFTIALIFLLAPPLFAEGKQVRDNLRDQSQLSVSAEQNALLPKTQSSQLNPLPATTSIDFMMDSFPVSQSPTGQKMGADPNTVAVSAGPSVPIATPLPITPVTVDQAEVAMLVSEQCSQSGEKNNGIVSCARSYSNGHHAKIVTEHFEEGDESKQQTLIEEFDAKDHLLYKKTIRYRLDYNYLNDKKAKEQELFDIVYQPTGKKTTRELMIYQFYLDTGKPKSMSWTQYKQIGNEAKAGLVYHASLRYGENGAPERGIAEKWDTGQKIATYMNWSLISRGYADLDQDTWNDWESWIRNILYCSPFS